MLSSSHNFSSSSCVEEQTHSTGVQSGPALGFEDDYDYDRYDDLRMYEDDEVYCPMNELMSDADCLDRGYNPNRVLRMPDFRPMSDAWCPGYKQITGREEPEDCKSPYDQYWDKEERYSMEEARLDKEEWYSTEEAKLPMVMMTIVSVTVIHSPFLAGLIIEYMSPIHPDDMGDDELLALEDTYESDEETYLEEEPEPESDPEPEPHWWLKGFGDEESYDAEVKAAKKKWHRTRSLAKHWGAKWRWKRHDKAHAALIALTWP
jgi:hypothetical protein